MLRIDERKDSGKVTLALVGVLDSEAAAEVRRALKETGGATLDLTQLRRVDRDGIGFLISLMRDGVGLMGVPCYIQTWLLQEMKI